MYTLVIACYFLILLVCFVVLGVSPVLAAAGAYVSVLAIAVKYWVARWREGTGLSAVEIETGFAISSIFTSASRISKTLFNEASPF